MEFALGAEECTSVDGLSENLDVAIDGHAEYTDLQADVTTNLKLESAEQYQISTDINLNHPSRDPRVILIQGSRGTRVHFYVVTAVHFEDTVNAEES